MEGVRSVRSARGRGRSRSKSGRSQGPTGDVIALGDKNRRADVLQVNRCLTVTKLKTLCNQIYLSNPQCRNVFLSIANVIFLSGLANLYNTKILVNSQCIMYTLFIYHYFYCRKRLSKCWELHKRCCTMAERQPSLVHGI